MIAEQRRQLGAKRHPCGACQRREIDHEVRFLFAGQRDRIGEDQPPLGIGIADLNRHAGTGVDDVEQAASISMTRRSRPLAPERAA